MVQLRSNSVLHNYFFQDSKKWIKKITGIFFINLFDNISLYFFFLKIIWKVCEKKFAPIPMTIFLQTFQMILRIFCFLSTKIIFGGKKRRFVPQKLRPQAPDAFGLNYPSQLVIGYHWLVLNVNVNHRLNGDFCTKMIITRKIKKVQFWY